MAFSLQEVGFGLVMLGIVLFIVEAMAPGFFIAVPATILLLLGGFALLVPDFGIFSFWAPVLAIVVGLPVSYVTLRLYRRIAPPDDAPTTRTATNLVGQTGIVTVNVDADSTRGKVKIQHESWSATTHGPRIVLNERVRVVAVDGVIVIVEPVVE